jgi:hypothetical protein
MAAAIPFGQPILIGHHSEGRDRNYRNKIHNTFGKAYELENKADYYETKAQIVGKGGISSDDPEAVAKLRAQLVALQARQEFMKKANASIRCHKGDEAAQITALAALDGVTKAVARELVKPDFAGRIGFASYQLSNNNANIRRIASRIKERERIAERIATEKAGDGYTYREDPEENRAMFLFDGKPAKDTRDTLKKNGFRWSPTRGAWVRQLTGNTQWAVRQVICVLDAVEQA